MASHANIMEYVGWKSSATANRYGGLAASASAVSAGDKPARERELSAADALPLWRDFAKSTASFPRKDPATRAKLELWG